MNLWTNDEINKILLQLDEKELPFKQYSLIFPEGKTEILGRGGSALVFDAIKRSNGESGYAIKVIGFSGRTADSEFFNESIVAQRLIGDHRDNVVRIYDHKELWLVLDENDNVISAEPQKPGDKADKCIKLQFVAMEKIPAIIKKDTSENVEITPEGLANGDEKELLKLAYDICLALKRAHENNILHRDIKPENVFYSDRKKQYKLGDFGIAKQTEDGFASTVAFTKGYAAPEVRGTPDNDRYDCTADIYSWGMMLYVLANNLKFPDSDTYSVNPDVQYRKGYVLQKTENGNISDGFYSLMAKACMYDPDDRYQSMDEVQRDLERLMFNENFAHKKERRTESLAVGMIFLIMGVIARKLTAVSDVSIILSPLQYAFFTAGVIKGLLSLFKKHTALISFLLLCLGIALLTVKGISWGIVLLVLLMVFSAGPAAGFIGVGTLLINFLTILEGFNENGAGIYAHYSWVAILFMSFAFVMVYQYEILSFDDRKVLHRIYTRDLYRILICLIYLMIFLNGALGQQPLGEGRIIRILLGDAAMEYYNSINTILLGLSGLVLCAVWIVRDEIILHEK